MSQIFESLFAQYATYESLDIILEITGVVFGLLSVWFAKKNHIWVFPTGMVSTSIYVYLLLKWGLVGDMLINAYYFGMSVYGWVIWTRVNGQEQVTPISRINQLEWRYLFLLFVGSLGFVYGVYQWFGLWNSSTAIIALASDIEIPRDLSWLVWRSENSNMGKLGLNCVYSRSESIFPLTLYEHIGSIE